MLCGIIHNTNNSGKLKVIKHNRGGWIKVEFIDTGYTTITSPGNIRSGGIRDHLLKKQSVFGFGVNDADYLIKNCPYYKRWIGMIGRCYSENLHARQPTYKDCTVCEEWKYFSGFKSWMEKQDWKGKHLDKDIIKPGNKHYSPENCCFVSPALNSLLNYKPSTNSGLPIGVENNGDGFRVNMSINGKNKSLGTHNTAKEAGEVYCKAKTEHVLEIANQQADIRIKNGLIKHAELIENVIF